MSGSSANLTVLPVGGNALATYPNVGPYSIKSGLSLTVEIYDDRLQQMPGGTTVAASLSSTVTGSITSPGYAPWPCTTDAPYMKLVNGTPVIYAGQQFTFVIEPTNPAPTTGLVGGTLYITVTTPLKLITTFAIPLTVN